MKSNVIQLRAFNISFYDDEKAGKRGTCYVVPAAHNCKLTTIDGLYGLFCGNPEHTKYRVDTVLRTCGPAIYLNTINKPIKDFILKHYTVYGVWDVPIGYNNGYQHHIVIKNPNSGYSRPTEFKVEGEEALMEAPGITKERVKAVLVATLKKKRRKSDYVDELVNSL